jgi:hypothetical protein
MAVADGDLSDHPSGIFQRRKYRRKQLREASQDRGQGAVSTLWPSAYLVAPRSRPGTQDSTETVGRKHRSGRLERSIPPLRDQPVA